MKKTDIEIGAVYIAKVSGKLAEVRIESEAPFGGWYARNLLTHRIIRIRGVQRLRRKVEV